jgi:hypothetical protein
MKFIELTNAPVDLLLGVIFFVLGGYMVFCREKVIDALLASNKAFWSKIGFGYNEKITSKMTNFIMPVMGLLFFSVGILLTYRAIIFFVFAS